MTPPLPSPSSSIDRLSTLASHLSSSMAASTSFPSQNVPLAPEDALFGLARAFKADTSSPKVDLGIGAYRDNNAKPWVLPVVKKADEMLRKKADLDHEYAPIAGLPQFTSKAIELMLGATSPALREKRTTSLQTISGTGAVHLGALFLAKFYKGNRTVYLSDPTWANHKQIFSNVGLETVPYPYFSKSTNGLDFDGMYSTIEAAPDRSIILLHPCAHNPTGVDPTMDQWTKLADLMRRKNHFPFFDCAYQGFASGDLARDAAAIRYFVDQQFELLICQSFAKNFGLYGERAGCFHFITSPAPDASDTVSRIASQLAILQRSEISNPPLYGARIASTVLNDPVLFSEWEDNLRTMSGRIIEMRKELRSRLEKDAPGAWKHITDQIGMFSFTGLTEAQVQKLRDDHHIYMTKNGRISMAGLNTHNIDHVAQSIRKVVAETK
ncbi:hypothetical protein CDD81_2715 [Ophiocordyceps australis]|uniref:Aspartate aminotransferase n=1 Tax=Ophiocordyceps australis TaxID=1399860 RepID=A0A2C5YCF5_9HYPO|nr:hypothetical protein CDD81_2715 [Ophiocordyceps australis]